MPFDPCREWLGIDAVDLAVAHKILGLAAGEHDPLVIVRAADARLASLRAIDPGPFKKAHDAIVARVAEARDDLLEHAGPAAVAPQPPGPKPLSAPSPPRSHAGRRAPALPPPPPPVPPSIPPASNVDTAADGDGFRDTSVVVRPARPRRTSSSGGVFAGLSVVAALAAGVGAYAFWPKPGPDPHRKVASHHTTEPSAPALSSPEHAHRDEDRLERERAEAARRETLAEEARAHRDQEQEHQRKQAQEQEQERRERERREAERRQQEQEKTEAETLEQDARRLEADDRVKAEVAVDRALRDARAALRRRDEPAARRAIAAADKAAGEHGDLASRVDRWSLLVDYAKQLVVLEKQALDSANEGREYKIGGRTISIIEIGPQTFAYKEAGQIRRGSRASLPRAVERAILSQWFAGDNRAANHIFLGVHRLMDEQPDMQRVRAEWEIALAGEQATKSLMPLLDDPALAGAR